MQAIAETRAAFCFRA